jgi:hypothetical protein
MISRLFGRVPLHRGNVAIRGTHPAPLFIWWVAKNDEVWIIGRYFGIAHR